MFLDFSNCDYDSDIVPYIRNGILIDTCVFKIIVDGIVITKISKKSSRDFENILLFLDLIKMSNKWNKFFITPHILTEICRHLKNDYNQWSNYKSIIEEVIPILNTMGEKNVGKESILSYVDMKKPILEIGDISICLVADEVIVSGEKMALLSIDSDLNAKYVDSRNILVMNYQHTINNMS
jgi:hypothetical protein